MSENQTEKSILDSKPIKPKIDEFDLTEESIKKLENFRNNCKKINEIILFSLFLLLMTFGGLIIHIFKFEWELEVIFFIPSLFLSYVTFIKIIRLITKKELVELIFDLTKSKNLEIINLNFTKYEKAKSIYNEKNELFERNIRRTAWNYWLSLSAIEFENAVAELFEDNGWNVRTTSYKGDQGVDLFIEKDGFNAIVQCKTYKKVLGPNSARDLYGTMVAQNAKHAYLTAPGGFSKSTMDFCRGKPITLLDLDGLTKMFYNFENYMPYWIDNAKSIEDLQKGINKLTGSRKEY
ncbi:restriction endonuclease [Flavobacterium sp. LT1R49]|uniref:restriction endonuclease n=1 Tax=Flavobacterium arabinosi TaxID=3398737 RepID=UPI003A8BF52C